MSDNERAMRRKKWPILIVVIPTIVMVVWPLIFFGFFWIENISFSYADEFEIYKNRLSSITGEPSNIKKSLYLEKRTEELHELVTVAQIFPADCPEDGTDYFFFAEKVKKHRSYYDRFEAYVMCEWGDESFSDEIERLLSLIGPNKRKPLISNDLFILSAYVFCYEKGNFCYSLIDEYEKKIYYVALREVGSLNNIVFDHALAPTKRLQDSDLASEVPFGRFCY